MPKKVKFRQTEIKKREISKNIFFEIIDILI